MDQELAEALAMLEKANGALARIFNMGEGDDGSGVCDMCAGCPNCVEEGERCSTCHKVKDKFSKEWEYAQCESCSMQEGEGERDE
jgi:hypothetical protein